MSNKPANKKTSMVTIPVFSSITNELTGRHRRRVVAKRGVWIVHRTVESFQSGFSVTHVPTLYSAITSVSLPIARRALKAFAEMPGDWSFTDKAKMTKRQKQIGLRIKTRFLEQSRLDELAQARAKELARRADAERG